MELIKIGSDKLKIILTENDMAKYQIKTDSFDYSDTNTRRAFWALMDDAKRSTGFDAAKNSLRVQMYPSRSGGCEIYVLQNTEVLNAELINPKRNRSENFSGTALVSISSEKSRSGGKINIAFSFTALDELLGACRAVCSEFGESIASSAYKGEHGEYYLIVFGLCGGYFYPPDQLLKIGEYGKRENSETVLLYVREHASLICPDNAVETLGKL